MNPVATQRLRDGWTSVELREVARIVTGSTPSKAKTEYYGGSFPFVKPPELCHGPVNDAKDKLSDKGAEVADVAPVGSVLVSCIGNLGKTGRATQPVAFNQQINAIIPNDPNASKWIFYAVQTSDFASQLANVASATTISIVNKGKFSVLRIPVAPEDEQHEIVAEIEKQFTRLEAGVAGLRRVQANLKRYRAAVLKAACEGKLVPTEAELARQEGRNYETGAQLLERILAERRQIWSVRGKYKEPESPDAGKFPVIPKGWCYATLNQLSSRVSVGHVGPTSEFYCEKAIGVAFIRSQNVRPGRLSFDGMNYIMKDFHRRLPKSRLQAGDVLVVRVGANRGDVCVVPLAVDEVNCANIVFARPLCQLSSYLNLYLQSKQARDSLLGMTTGSAQGVLNTTSVAEIIVPVPPVAEQQRIVAEVDRRLSVVEELEAVVNANLQRVTRLHQSILQKAFSGNLSTP